MNNLTEKIQRYTFLSLFESHLLRIKPYRTKDEIFKRMRNKQCIFSGLLSHFKGDTVFREMRHYLTCHKDHELVRSMLTIINKTL